MQKSNWKKCSPQTNPAKAGYYLVYHPTSKQKQYGITQFMSDNNWKSTYTENPSVTGEPSHWCELPNPPSEDN